MKRWWILLLAISLVLPSGVQTGAAQGTYSTMTIDGLERTYSVTVPASYDATAPVPLVIALHPFASSGKAMQAITGLDAAAETHGFIVAYPDSFDLAWDDGRLAAFKLDQADDVQFISTLIDQLASDYRIGPVFLTGFGWGGSMAYRLACALPDRFAGLAVVNGWMGDWHSAVCDSASGDPLPVLILHGGDNRSNPVEGQTLESEDEAREILPAATTAAFWAEWNGCDLDAARTAEEPATTLYDACAAGAPVELVVLHGVGNNWPRTGAYVLNQFGADATTLVAEFFASGALPALDHDTSAAEVYDGMARSYTLYVPPAYDPARPTPLIMALHGRPGTAAGLAYLFDLNRVAAGHDFIVVYPDGIPVTGDSVGREWNYARGAVGYDDPGIDDVAFLSTLVDDLARDLNIDQSRLYVTGFSNGGFMTQRVACEAGDRWAGFASIGATVYPILEGLCSGKPPVPMLIMHGTDDVSVPWAGTTYMGQTIALSAPETAIFWAMQDGCDPQQIESVEIPPSSSATQVFRYRFTDCIDRSEVLYYVIEGGGHNIPGVPDRLDPEIAGSVNTDIHAGEEIWTFFERHALSQ